MEPHTTTRAILTPEHGPERLWLDAVRTGEAHAGVSLPQPVEGYLVSVLVAYTEETRFMEETIAEHFLVGAYHGEARRLARAAEHSLLVLGLFPGRMRRMLVGERYLLSAGRSSYDHLATYWLSLRLPDEAHLARSARDAFEAMARALRGMRVMRPQDCPPALLLS